MNLRDRISSCALVALLCSSGISLADPSADLLEFSPIDKKIILGGVFIHAELELDGCMLLVTTSRTNSDGVLAYTKVSSIDLAEVDASRIMGAGEDIMLWNADGSNGICENIVGDACGPNPVSFIRVPQPGDMMQATARAKFRIALTDLVAECQGS